MGVSEPRPVAEVSKDSCGCHLGMVLVKVRVLWNVNVLLDQMYEG